MQRDVEKELLNWKNQKEHTPLIIRGARQVGKSYTIEKFGKDHFESMLVVNFEEKPEAKACFESLDIASILKNLSYIYGAEIVPNKSLLFLDEIQNCPSAIKALRYFKEKLPELHVIAAGSLLEFVLENVDEPISFPVGRVRFLNMKPLSFREFIVAIGQGNWLELFENITLEKPIPNEFHTLIMKFVRDYFLVGGMPAAINAYITSESYIEALRTQRALIDFYRLDFIKYGQKKEYAHLQKLFETSPHFVSKHFRYSKIDPESTNPSREYKNALRKLQQAGVIFPIHMSAANGIPLKAEQNDKKFKLLFLDVGLLQCALDVDPVSFTTESLFQINSGTLAEQFVGQELLAYADCYLDPHLFFWETEKSGSAEVDYVITVNNQIIPIEVKAGSSKRLASLNRFLEIKNLPLGIHLSSSPLSYSNKILHVPFYLIKEIPGLISGFKK